MTAKLSAAGLIYAAGLSAQDSASKPLEFLAGTWEATTQGGSAGAAASGIYTFQTELRKHVLARHSTNSGCKGPADFDCLHGDLLYVYPNAAGQTYKAIYFGNEGHVIHYDVTVPGWGVAIFLSSPSEPGPQFRLTCELKESLMFGKFQCVFPDRRNLSLTLSGAEESQPKLPRDAGRVRA